MSRSLVLLDFSGWRAIVYKRRLGQGWFVLPDFLSFEQQFEAIIALIQTLTCREDIASRCATW
jgi:hypothetical protein